MTFAFLVLSLVCVCALVAYGAIALPDRARALLAAIASKPSAEAQVISLAKAEIAATKRGDLLAAARFAEQQEAVHG
ncbi:hypothetical protein [Stenotrophomonas indicatrix]|uniref:hypothetical protein n=1 Tax=Stenotrophomonas indicatrix TaxID=2045451 RepID=UPI0028AEE262|nr:hypothetical protein [Stenotrophomonas indicatrix]